MNNRDKLYALLNGKTSSVPFMPIFMRFCARRGNVAYRDFVLDAVSHCEANISVAERFGSCWVNVMSDPWCELDAYGGKIDYVADDLPLNQEIFCRTIDDAAHVCDMNIWNNHRTRGRLEQLQLFRQRCADRFSICGWVEGPVAEYCDWRGMENAFLDFYDDPGRVEAAIETILRNAERFINAQIDAGADCIGIGDAACSQIGRDFYLQFARDGEKRLIDAIHRRGAIAKLHICGNTSAILPDMISTGADIIDIDHLVRDMSGTVGLLAEHQFFCGNLDPVSVIQDGSFDAIRSAVKFALAQAPGKLIISGGCEITPDTPDDHLLFINSLAESSGTTE